MLGDTGKDTKFPTKKLGCIGRHCQGNRVKLGGIGNTVGEIWGRLEYPRRDCGQYREYRGRLEGRTDPELAL